MVKAIIFDCFGVLIGRGFEATYRRAGGDPIKDRDFINGILGQANLAVLSPVQFHEAIASKLQIPIDSWHKTRTLSEQPDVVLLRYIEQLHKKYKTAVLSNANKDGVIRRIGQEWADKCFDAIVVSGEVGMVKPDPQIYQYVAGELGVSPAECAFIDDSKGHVSGARAVGMKTILYRDLVQMKTDLQTLLSA